MTFDFCFKPLFSQKTFSYKTLSSILGWHMSFVLNSFSNKVGGGNNSTIQSGRNQGFIDREQIVLEAQLGNHSHVHKRNRYRLVSLFTTQSHHGALNDLEDCGCWTVPHCRASDTPTASGRDGRWWCPPPPLCAWPRRCPASWPQLWHLSARHQGFLRRSAILSCLVVFIPFPVWSSAVFFPVLQSAFFSSLVVYIFFPVWSSRVFFLFCPVLFFLFCLVQKDQWWRQAYSHLALLVL